MYFAVVLLLVVVLPCALLYFAIVKAAKITKQQQKLFDKNVLVVVAQAGDECRYFGPTITQLSYYNHVTILCVSEPSLEFKQSCSYLECKSAFTKEIKRDKFDVVITYDENTGDEAKT